MTIKEYCKSKGISLTEFASGMGVMPQQVTNWINAGWLIYDGWMLSPKRKVEV